MKNYITGTLALTSLIAIAFISIGCAEPTAASNSKPAHEQPAVAITETTFSRPETSSESITAKVAHSTVELTKDNFEELVIHSDKPVLVDFWASWCGPCRAIAPSLESLASEYGNEVLIGKINVDEQKELASLFKISSIPALMYIKDGKVVNSSLGAESKTEIESHIKELLN